MASIVPIFAPIKFVEDLRSIEVMPVLITLY